MPFNRGAYWRGPEACAAYHAKGLSDDEIAARLGLKRATVVEYRRRADIMAGGELQRFDDETAASLSHRDIIALRERVVSIVRCFATDADFARKVGIAPNNVTHWRNDKWLPRPTSLMLICLRLGISAEWLLLGKGDPPEMLNAFGLSARGAHDAAA